jgi:potassium/hydrogen antiporter
LSSPNKPSIYLGVFVEISTIIFLIGLLIFLAHLFSGLFERTRIPDVLPLVFIGLLVGPLLGLVSPSSFGQVGNVFISITLIIILFEGGLGLDFSTLRESLAGGVRLTVINFILTGISVAFFAIRLMGLSPIEGAMLGAILGGTSSAVVIPIVEKLRLKDDSRTMLFLESTFSDVLCIVVTLALLQTVRYNELRPGVVLGQIIASFLLAAVIGALFALAWSSILSSIRRLENSIFLTPAFVFIVYGITDALGYSGAISALAFGVTLGNIRSITQNIRGLKLPSIVGGILQLRPISLNDKEKAFFAEVVFLLKTFFFVYLGLSFTLHDINLLAMGFLVTLIVFLIRIPVVLLSMDKAIMKLDASLAAVITPKGLAAAVLATLPLQAGIANGAIIQDIVYAVILYSITATAILSFLLERGIIKQPYEFIFSGYGTEKMQ